MAQRAETKLVRMSDVTEIGCAWRGCDAACGVNERPAGWRDLLVYGGNPADIVRQVKGHTVIDLDRMESLYWDSVLCPQHALALDGLLKDIGMLKDSAGTA
jgi:hypothetical protein